MTRLHAAVAALFRDALRRGRGCVAVASSARRRGVRIVIGCICGTLVFACSAVITPREYRACLHVHPPKKTSIVIHFPGWVTSSRAEKTATRYEFIADAMPDRKLSIVCSRCMSSSCEHVNAAAATIALAERSERTGR